MNRSLIVKTVFRSRSSVVQITRRALSDWGKGQDLLGDSLDWGDKPKVILDGYAPSGFDVINVIEKVKDGEEVVVNGADSGAVHMAGSVIAFPNACFLWNVKSINDVTLESLAPAVLHRPKLEYLFIGCDQPMDPEVLYRIKQEMRETANIVVEQLDIGNACGTFNILNGEDRPIAAALVLENDDDDDDVET
eukprot:CAMPEP_0119015054 /NCGR_PEP_ID=MMETSP1176-20130426/10534_1 /TAXON_ID=265551 /ORGANISM="Synedropsis recta cf, Strain CCMP1620" /LENGTH=191 /DNA_ID=CAMNT_0006968315 /DNA_START=98 /DNA_END=673 /DNA_ORIENTATION=-